MTHNTVPLPLPGWSLCSRRQFHFDSHVTCTHMILCTSQICETRRRETYDLCFSETGLIYLMWIPPAYPLSCKWHSFVLYAWINFYLIVFIRPSIVGHLDCIHNLTVVNCAVISNDVKVSRGCADLETSVNTQECCSWCSQMIALLLVQFYLFIFLEHPIPVFTVTGWCLHPHQSCLRIPFFVR